MQHYNQGYDELYHYGVLGMKWGIRKDTLTGYTKHGDVVTLSPTPTPKMTEFLASHSKKIRDNVDNTANFSIKNKEGKTIGDLQLFRESKDSINVTWVSTNEGVQGRGYGTAVMRSAIRIAKELKVNRVTLEVPGSSPDARHIYEKLGFKEVSSPNRDVNDSWGGLTNMVLTIDDSLYHSMSNRHFAKQYMSILISELNNLDPMEVNQMQHYNQGYDELYHYGVLGMRWGKRNAKEDLTPEQQRRRKTVKKVLVGTAAVATVAAAGLLYKKNKPVVDAFVKNYMTGIKESKAIKQGVKAQKLAAYAAENKSKILKDARLIRKYKDFLDQEDVGKAISGLRQINELHSLQQSKIRKGADYAQSFLAYASVGTAAYNLKNTPLFKDATKKRQ